jgi:ferredoxin
MPPASWEETAVKKSSHEVRRSVSLRTVVQGFFLALTVLIGIQFTIFAWQLRHGTGPTVGRPPGVEAFLPISSLISLRYWLLSGVFNRIHPAGLVLLLIIGAVSLLLKRGFCSWVCPFGLLADCLEKVHRALFRRRLSLPGFLDYPLRSLKYLLLLFFVRVIFVRMDGLQLERFIESPYNRVADLMMLRFFAPPSPTTLVVLAVLTALTLVVPFVWCRYLCPYGALLGGLSLLSPFKIRRDPGKCISCERCSAVCPARIKVHRRHSVRSDECHACLRCVEACPVAQTLSLSLPGRKVPVPKRVYAAALILAFLLGTSAARLAGRWHNAIPEREYRLHVAQMQHPAYRHNRGTVPDYDLRELGLQEAGAAADGAPLRREFRRTEDR